MSTLSRTEDRRRPSWLARRAGYTAAIVANAVILFIAHNLLAWDILPFLTEDFERVLPLITLSVVANIIANVIFIAADPQWMRSLLDAVVSAVSLAATVRLLTVFPFDFPPDSVWDTAVTVLLVLVIVGTAIAVVVNLVKGVVALFQEV